MEEFISIYVNPERDEDEHNSALESINKLFVLEGGSNSKITLTDLIKLLESFLTSSVDKIRYRATLLLADVLHSNPELSLNSAVIHLLVSFFNQRLTDYPSIIPSLQSLVALIKFHNKNMDKKYSDFVDIFENIFKALDVQSYAQNIRQKVFEVFNEMLLLEIKNNSFTSQHADKILNGLLISIEGEKDPRCLSKALEILNLSILSYPDDATEQFSEKVSSLLSAYFPITFQPPSDDPYGITAEILITKLHNCYLSHRLLLPYVLPFLINDHLLSDLSIGKIHSMGLVVDLCKKYGVSILTNTFGDTIYQPTIHRFTDGVFENATETNSDKMVIVQAKKTIYEIATLIGAEQNSSDTIEWKLFGEPILHRIQVILAENQIDSLKARESLEIANILTSSSFTNASIVLHRILPLLSTTESIEKQNLENIKALVRLVASVGFHSVLATYSAYPDEPVSSNHIFESKKGLEYGKQLYQGFNLSCISLKAYTEDNVFLVLPDMMFSSMSKLLHVNPLASHFIGLVETIYSSMKSFDTIFMSTQDISVILTCLPEYVYHISLLIELLSHLLSRFEIIYV
jgi:DNA repair/transcription protein MET18/MMS19